MATERPILLAQHSDAPGLSAVETPTPTVPGETHAAVEAHPGEHAGHGAFPPFDPATFGPQLLWLVITFGVLYYVLSKFILPRLGGLIEERAERISDDLAEAERLRAETDAAAARHEQALAEARANAAAIANQARDAAKAEADTERRGLEEGLAGRMAAAEAEISAMKTRAIGQVDTIAVDVAEAMVEALGLAGVGRDEIAGAVAVRTAGGRSR